MSMVPNCSLGIVIRRRAAVVRISEVRTMDAQLVRIGVADVSGIGYTIVRLNRDSVISACANRGIHHMTGHMLGRLWRVQSHDRPGRNDSELMHDNITRCTTNGQNDT